ELPVGVGGAAPGGVVLHAGERPVDVERHVGAEAHLARRLVGGAGEGGRVSGLRQLGRRFLIAGRIGGAGHVHDDVGRGGDAHRAIEPDAARTGAPLTIGRTLAPLAYGRLASRA